MFEGILINNRHTKRIGFNQCWAVLESIVDYLPVISPDIHVFSIITSHNFFDCDLKPCQFQFCSHSRINMVGTQDALEFDKEEGEGKKSSIFCSIKYEFCLLLRCCLFFSCFCCLLSLECSLHVLCLLFLEEFSILEFQNLKSQVFKFLVVFVLQVYVNANSHLSATSHLTPPCLLLIPWLDTEFEKGIDQKEFSKLCDFHF